MNLYFVECDEYSYLTSFQNETLPSFFSFQSLQVHDTIVFLVNAHIAGIAIVENEDENEKKLRFTHLFQQGNRLPLLGDIRSLLVEEWGINIDEKIINHTPVSEPTSSRLLERINEVPSDVGFFLTNMDFLVEEAEEVWKKAVKKQQKEKVNLKFDSLVGKTIAPPTTDHAKAQFYLKEIAKITNCSAWTANNDKNRLYKGEKLGSDDMEQFPAFELEEEVKKRIQLIDTIWFQGDFPVSCFEVETSTSVFSGLLRMSDLVAVMPGSGVKLYIVAPNERKKKVMNEMNRPVFRAIGLPHIARFISIESLETLYQKIKGLDGYISPHVIDAISLSVEEMSILESF